MLFESSGVQCQPPPSPVSCLKVAERCIWVVWVKYARRISPGSVIFGVKTIPLCSAKTDRHQGLSQSSPFRCLRLSGQLKLLSPLYH
ncbi:hypothetical protein TNCV_600951 [Trichonephila clavipes]|nr:hypothetical protein TNCV_600951 [Trichonephila clavipes]